MPRGNPSRPLVLVSLLLLVCTLSACEKATNAGPPGLDKSKFEGLDALGRVEVLGTGSGEKRELRFLFDAGTSERMRMSLELKSETGVDGGSMAVDMGMNYVMSTTMREHVDNKARLHFAIDKFELDPATTSPMLYQAMGSMRDILEGMSGSMELDDRGQILDIGYDMSSVPAAMRDSLQQMEEGLKRMTTTFPMEAVGVGATWRLYQNLKAQGIDLRQQLDIEVVKFDGAVVHLKTKVAQDADVQTAKMAGMPAGASAQVLSFWSTGSGTLVIDLKGVVPVRGSTSLSTKGTFQLDMGGEPVKMKMKADIIVSMERI